MVRAMERTMKTHDLELDAAVSAYDRSAITVGACFLPSSKVIGEIRSTMLARARELELKRPRLLEWALRFNPSGATTCTGVAFAQGRNAEGFLVRFNATVALY